MNNFYKFFIQSIASGRVTSKTNVDQMIKRSANGMGIGAHHKVTTHYNMSAYKHKLKRHFAQKPSADLEDGLDEFLKKVKSIDLKDSSKKPEEVLTAFMKEKYLSLSLVNAQSLGEVLDIMKKADFAALNVNEVSLLLFYLADFDGELECFDRIEQLVDRGLELFSSQPPEDSSNSLLLSLGLLCFKKRFEVTAPQVARVVELLGRAQLSEASIVELLKATTYILETHGHMEAYKQSVRSILGEDGTEVLMKTQLRDNVAVLELLFYLHRSEHHDEVLVKYLISQILRNGADVPTAINAIVAIHSLGFKDADAYQQLFDIVMGSIAEVSADYCVSLLEVVASNDLKTVPFSKLVNAVHHQINLLSIDGYVDMWRLVGIMKHKKFPLNADKTVEVLKKCFGGNTWGMKDLELWDIISVLSSLSIIKDQDVAFAHDFIKEVFRRKALDSCEVLQLFSLAKLVYAYSRIYEDAFLEIHEACVRRAKDMPPEYRAALKELFVLRKDIIKHSPFFAF